MSFIKKHKTKIIIVAAAVAVLAFAFWRGGAAPGLQRGNTEPFPSERTSEEKAPKKKSEPTPEPTKAAEADEIPVKKPGDVATSENKPERKDNKSLTAAEKAEIAEKIAEQAQSDGYAAASNNSTVVYEFNVNDKHSDENVPENHPLPAEPNDAVITDKELTCTLSVRCDTILDNIAWLTPEKAEIVPEDGVIYDEREVVFYEGESVFNVLLREMKKNKIHMEYENTPIYNSAYIEGIGNLYEYDCGELSGWMYKVNGWFPNYGCSRYKLKDGDKVEWVYTCNLGVDTGGYNKGVSKEQ